ncbi:MAG: hypothetical protein SFY32_13750, partial [Bacteroidota bacterium]|nr:hypothetical protein [Bacteroidota bacterium]
MFFTISLLAQPGKDGNLTVSTTNVVVNTYTNLSSNAFAGQTSIQVGSASALSPTLGAGDLIMIYQAQGATIQTTDDKDYGKILDYNGAGNYEYQYVKSVVGNTIYLNCALTQKYIVSGRTQVLKVPQYDILTINSGASIVPLTWNGTIGGIIAIHAKNRIINNGTIRAAGFGFRGGDKENLTLGNTTANNAANFIYRSLNPAEGGEKGESIAGYQTDYDAPGMGGRYGRGAPANGGGGGNAHNSAGGGGANGDNGKVYSGAGVMDPNPLYYDAWRLDPDFILNGNTLTNSSGGGRGGYTYSANVQNPLTLGPSYAQIIDGVTTIPAVANTAWGGDGRKANGGRGGRPLSTDPEKRIFIGGGGGAG